MQATEAMAQQMIKSKERASKNKEIMDFKVRALDFLSIYIKEKHYQQRPVIQIKLIRGLLQSLSVAHRDGHKALFDSEDVDGVFTDFPDLTRHYLDNRQSPE